MAIVFAGAVAGGLVNGLDRLRHRAHHARQLALRHIDPRLFKIGVGAFLVAYTSYMLTRRAWVKMTWGGGIADCAVGILGGIAGLSGMLPAVWTDMRGWAKEHRRGVLQIFNIAILALALASHVASGLLTRQVAVAAIVALPGTIGGARLGVFIYTRASPTAAIRASS